MLFTLILFMNNYSAENAANRAFNQVFIEL
jgi:hypothetical protein